MEDRRKFKRITYYLGQEAQQKLEGASITWPNGELSYVLDLSYQGAAISFPLNFSIEELHEYELKLTLTEGRSFMVTSQVRWFTNRAVGIQFVALPADARRAFEEFMSDKLIGASLFMVNKQYYSKDNTPDAWYHGPQDTNVYFWFDSGKLSKLVLELDGQTLTYEDQKITLSQQVAEADIKEHYQDEKPSVYSDSSLLSRQSFYSRALSVLSQIDEQKPFLNSLFLLLRRP